MEENYSNIAPYNDAEASAALYAVACHPAVPWVSKYIFPNRPETYLGDILKSVKTVDEFQHLVMSKAVDMIIETSMNEFTYSGLENLQSNGGVHLCISNHRDIILDPAILQNVLAKKGLPTTEICVGDNLLKDPTVEKLIRSNRMIKVIRGVSAREVYLSSVTLSNYIREDIVSKGRSVWIAQRQGRTKNGHDVTEQGLMKMFDMSGTKDFVENYKELNIVPISISYEYEPCDILKARELLISRTQTYVKTEHEDLQSIMLGIRQYKGNVHLNINEPLTDEEIIKASDSDKNDRYKSIRDTLSYRIMQGYKLWKTNYIAYDMMNDCEKYADQYTAEDREKFNAYLEEQLKKVEPELNAVELKDILLHIYGNPVVSKEEYGFI